VDVPEEIFKVFIRMARGELPKAFWLEVKTALLEESVIA